MAFGSFGGQSDAPLAEMNVTPLVDVMLVLLIVFMVTMPVMTHSLNVNLPSNPGSVTVQADQAMRLEVDANGSYRLNDQAVSADDLTSRLQQGDVKEATLAISADKSVPYDYVARAISAARQAGISKFGLINAQIQ
ncbi:MAG: biopolymer transporter ExbD [Neisseria sp.]|uniref:ExbD/TolR family protein n=1 Tax=Neisseria sp. TaxID=192066 RepID=UPI0026DB8249|nr:biopolymer transporter ExbD [Neisseria sp.]MDO4249437.1 biopolymer transporter ExbD [Neisseria sp.]